MIRLLIFIAIGMLSGCATNVVQTNNLSKFPIKIGLIADTQYTTEHETYQDISQGKLDAFRGPTADKYSPVSVRPPAVELYALSLMEHLLEKLAEEVDLILYLGDAANSGCFDELQGVFSILSSIREEKKVPIYFLIGNHDYLGTGNQTNINSRERLCSSERNKWNNGYVTKTQLLEGTESRDRTERLDGIRKFNSDSNRDDNYFEYIETNFRYESPREVNKCDFTHYGDFYAAILRPREPNIHSIDILLADTSDYSTTTFLPRLQTLWSCEFLGGFGLKGSMSHNQTTALQQLGCQWTKAKCDSIGTQSWPSSRNPQYGVDYRVVASHYDPNGFNMVIPWKLSPSYVRDNLGFLLSDGENIWLSAHHHDTVPVTGQKRKYPVGMTMKRGPQGQFQGFSVGSTTDWHPHVAIVEALTEKNSPITDRVGYRTIKGPHPNQGSCKKVFDYANENLEIFKPVICTSKSKQAVTTLNEVNEVLGVEKIYRNIDCWSHTTKETVRHNVEKLVNIAKDHSQFTERDVRLCIVSKGSLEESLE